MTSEEFFKLCPGATWPDELSEPSWQEALRNITQLMEAEYQRGLDHGMQDDER